MSNRGRFYFPDDVGHPLESCGQGAEVGSLRKAGKRFGPFDSFEQVVYAGGCKRRLFITSGVNASSRVAR